MKQAADQPADSAKFESKLDDEAGVFAKHADYGYVSSQGLRARGLSDMFNDLRSGFGGVGNLCHRRRRGSSLASLLANSSQYLCGSLPP